MLGARLRARESSANPGCVHVNSLLMLASSRNTRIFGRIHWLVSRTGGQDPVQGELPNVLIIPERTDEIQ